MCLRMLRIFPLLVLLALVLCKECSKTTNKGDTCTIYVDDLCPTQFAVGLMECKCKRSFLESLSKKDLVDYLSNKKRIIPIIIGDGGFYMKDRHHLTRALNDADVDDSLKYLTCSVTENWVSHKKFWSRMIEEEHVWLYDEKGMQPVSPLHLPRHADKLVDDPFRSLAWMVRNAGGYGKSDLPFAELMWTNFF